MPDYRIFETAEFQKALARFSPSQVEFIAQKLRARIYPQLRKQPFFGPNIRKLQGYAPETWRYRVGRYRLFYMVNDEERVVFMLTADDRKDAYR